MKDGYARNFLLPNGLVKIVSHGVLEELKVKQARDETERQERVAKHSLVAKKIEAKPFVFQVRVHEKGEVFGSVQKKDIEARLKELRISYQSIELNRHIKELGEHTVSVDFGDGVFARIAVVLEPQK